MNRLEKERLNKRKEARKGLTAEQVQLLDAQDAEHLLVEKLARKMHTKQFSEEFDFVYDSIVDAAERRRGINPMSEAYIAKVNEKRQQQGVSPLAENGLSLTNETLELCMQEAKEVIGRLHARINNILLEKWNLMGDDASGIHDECSSYAAEALQLAFNNSSHKPLAEYLFQHDKSLSEGSESKERAETAAELIFTIVNDQAHSPNHIVGLSTVS